MLASADYTYELTLSEPLIIKTIDENGGAFNFRVSPGDDGLVYEMLVSEKPLQFRKVKKEEEQMCEKRFSAYAVGQAKRDLLARAALSGLDISE